MVGNVANKSGTVQVPGSNSAKPQVSDAPAEKKSYREQVKAYKTSLNQEILKGVTYTSNLGKSGSKTDQDDFSTLVANLLTKQGISREQALSGTLVNIDEETRQKAKDLISDDGFWGVKQTSSRIADFAIQSAGGDPAKLEKMKGAVEKGFKMAQEAFGGTLPEISHKTFESALTKMDEWAEKLNSTEKNESV